MMDPVSARIKDDRRIALIMISPATIGLLLFVILPFAIAVIISFTNFRLGSPLPIEFLGFDQYRRIWLDPSFRRALLNKRPSVKF